MADILHKIDIDATPDKVYSAVSSNQGLKSWWTTDVVGDSKKGSILNFEFYSHSFTFEMYVDELIPDKTVRWTCIGGVAADEWKDTKLLWEIVPKDGNQTTLKFSHTGWPSTGDYYSRCNTTWGHLMFMVKDYAERGTVNPYFT
jgi:uncharacterized protein YndB with AHSA1/START domain